MKSHPPYKILHIDLAERKFDSNTLDKSQAYYLVFWRHNIPVGELYVEPDESRTGLEKRILDLIASSQQQTSSGEGLVPSGIKDVSVIICTRNRAEQLRNC